MNEENELENVTELHTLKGNNKMTEEQVNRPISPLRRQRSEPASKRYEVFASLSKRTNSMKENVRREAAEFFGVDDEKRDYQLWTLRQKRLVSRKFGKLKKGDTLGQEQVQDKGSDVSDGFAQNIKNYITSAITGDYDDVRTETNPKDSVYKLTWNGLTYMAGTLRKKFASLRPEQQEQQQQPSTSGQQVTIETQRRPMAILASPIEAVKPKVMLAATMGSEHIYANDAYQKYLRESSYKPPAPATQVPAETERLYIMRNHRASYRLNRSGAQKITEDRTIIQKKGMFGDFFEKVFLRLFRKGIKPEMEEVVDDYDDYRPYFTYWITTVHTLIFVLTVILNGFGPFGFSRTQITALVLTESISLQQVDYYEPDNFWIGPRAADLIHLGAKFTPCMRKDKLIYDEIWKERILENSTGCCIRNDYSGCVQTSQYQCSDILSKWHKWDQNSPRNAGPVCGQDPDYCIQPASAKPNEWPDDLTKWPICKKMHKNSGSVHHMKCDVIAKPCCIGINGECKILTREHCEFLNGYFHDEAALCSQVSCMADVCGMMPFFRPDSPNQVYRLFTSLFLHAGVIHLIITIFIHWYFMRDLEKMMGPLRMCLLYLFSGIAGNLASAIFIPYRAEVGPSGSQFALLACLIVQLVNYWNALEHPIRALLKIVTIALILFSLGTFPWIDNYAHISGFTTGLLLSFIFVPYISISPYKDRRVPTIIICAVLTSILFLLLVIVFIFPIYKTPSFLKYFNCIPFTQHWCADQDIKVVRVDKL